MAFKMKGSPHKMGKIEGTSGHTSALKQKEVEASALKDYSQNQYHSRSDSYNPDAHPHKKRERGSSGLVESGAKEIKSKERKKETEGGPKMKSPMKDTQSWGINPKTGGWDSDWAEKDSHNKKHKSGAWNKDHKTKKEVEYEKEGGGKGIDKELGLDREEEMEGGPKMKSPVKQRLGFGGNIKKIAKAALTTASSMKKKPKGLKMKSPTKQKKEEKKGESTKSSKTRINPKTGKHEMHTGSKIDPITRKKTETYSTY